MAQGTLFPPLRTLDDARAEVEAGLDDGIVCPCCGQLARLYRRKLNSNQAAFLVSLVRLHLDERYAYDAGDGWVHYKRCTFAGRDYNYLRAWGLAVMRERAGDDSTRRVSGYWKPTGQGVMFARGLVRVPMRVFLYNNEIRGYSAETVDIREALGSHFDFDELWGRS